MKRREPKPDDQDKAAYALSLIREFMLVNRDVEPVMWMGAFWTIIANAFHGSGYDFEFFSQRLDEVKKHYKGMWDEESN